MTVLIDPKIAGMRDKYLFAEIAARVAAYRQQHPYANILSLGIGDVSLPLAAHIVEAIRQAAEEMGCADTVHGYPPTAGYPFLKEAIARYYRRRGVSVPTDSIFISDGAKSDFARMATVIGNIPAVIPDPTYPAYVDANRMAGREILRPAATAENGYLPMPEGLPEKPLLIYLCSPGNPTGAVYTHEQLAKWVAFCRVTGSLLLFDAAYEGFADDRLPHSIYEVAGAEACAVEIGSLSKSAGFTGVRCGWCIIPPETGLAAGWERHLSATFNGVSYPVQRGAAAALDDTGIAEWQTAVAYYKENATVLANALNEKGIPFVGGENAPYLWCRIGGNSREMFERLLAEQQLVVTPGIGFGRMGEGHLRLSAFGKRDDMLEAAERILRFD